MADGEVLTALNSMLLEHLALAGLELPVLQEVEKGLHSSSESLLTSDLARVYQCGMQGQLVVRGALLSGRECSISVNPWTTVSEAKAIMATELGIFPQDYSLTSNEEILLGSQAIGRHVSPAGHTHLTLVRLDPRDLFAQELDSLSSGPAKKQMIGERLYPKVRRINEAWAGKLTGMILEMDNAELLEILESDELLLAKVQEGLHVLRQAGEADGPRILRQQRQQQQQLQ
ncbi:pab1 [Symbiodinium sp. CCMP2456]|nr:pab1 [Symbiodinium sp. CCMP2456]